MLQEYSEINCKLAHNSHIIENMSKFILQINSVNVNISQKPLEKPLFLLSAFKI
jgi:hypothetical protein